jgi:hypothetical protein
VNSDDEVSRRLRSGFGWLLLLVAMIAGGAGWSVRAQVPVPPAVDTAVVVVTGGMGLMALAALTYALILVDRKIAAYRAAQAAQAEQVPD